MVCASQCFCFLMPWTKSPIPPRKQSDPFIHANKDFFIFQLKQNFFSNFKSEVVMRKFSALLVVVAAVCLIAARAPEGQWKPLFNGKDLTGWKHVGPGNMTVENGLIQTHGGMGLLYWTGGKLGNCRIRVVYKMRDTNDNSGVFIRIPVEPREEWMPVHYGYEVQIDNHPETSGEDE